MQAGVAVSTASYIRSQTQFLQNWTTPAVIIAITTAM